MNDPRYHPEPKEPDTEYFTLTIYGREEVEQTVIVYLTIFSAPRLQDREIYGEIKMPILIPLDPGFSIDYQLANALYSEGIRGDLKSVSYIVNGEQVTI